MKILVLGAGAIGSVFGGFLAKLENSPDPCKHLWRQPRLPFFEQLCKWLSRHANCRTFETAIVDSAGNVRICWYATPTGTIADSHKTIVNTFMSMAAQTTRERDCHSCRIKATCIKCAYPYPLSPASYCEFRRSRGLNSVAEFIGRIQNP